MLTLDDYEDNFLREWKQIHDKYWDEKKELSNQLDQLKQSYYLEALKLHEKYDKEDLDDILDQI